MAGIASKNQTSISAITLDQGGHASGSAQLRGTAAIERAMEISKGDEEIPVGEVDHEQPG